MFIRTADEMNMFKVERAEDDAQADIRSNNIRLFFEDRSEVPEILGNEDILQAVPEFTHTSIGTGCMDDINDDDCPAPYKAAYENALRYGERYNKIVAAHFIKKEDVQPQDNPLSQLSDNSTKTFMGPEPDWPGLVITLHDMAGPLGGREITIQGNGRTELSAAGPEEIFLTGSLDRKDVLRLLTVFIRHDFLSITLEIPVLPPDTPCPTVALKNSDGQEHQVTGWVVSLFPGETIDTPVKGFNQIYNELLRIERIMREQMAPGIPE